MKFPVWLKTILVGSLVTTVIGLEAWTLTELISLKVTVAGLVERVDLLGPLPMVKK